MSKQINFRCTDEEHARLKALAETEGLSVSALLKSRALGESAPVRKGDEMRGANGRHIEPTVMRAPELGEFVDGVEPVATVAESALPTPVQLSNRIRVPVATAKRLLDKGRVTQRDGTIYVDGQPT